MLSWALATNPFESLTLRRFTAMDALLADHAARCASRASQWPGDSDLSFIHQRAMAARTAWNVAYLKWTVSRRTHKGRTFAVQQLIADLRGRQIELWQLMIQKTDFERRTWLKGGHGFSRLFPKGRLPFQQGGIDARIAAVAALSAALAALPSLTEAHHAVRAFQTSLATARSLQLEIHSITVHAAAAIEVERKSACVALYRNMARLMEKYADSPGMIWHFFDRKLLDRMPAKP